MNNYYVKPLDTLNPESLNTLKNRVWNSKPVQKMHGFRQKMTFNSLLFTEIRHSFTNYDTLIKGVKLSDEEYIDITNQVGEILKIVLRNEVKNITNWVNIRNKKRLQGLKTWGGR